MLTTNQQQINLGRVRNGEPRKMKFALINSGENPVKIESLMVGCGKCTVASMDQQTVSPGETASLNVTFTPDSTGNQVKNVTVKFTGGALTVKFSAEVI
jgi:hypothetical protein